MKQQEDLSDRISRWEGTIGLPIQISGVLFALDIVFIQNLVQGGLNPLQTISLLLFAIALPCLAANAFIMFQMRLWKEALPGKSRLFFLIQQGGYYGSIFAVGTSIASASWWIGIVFVVLAFLILLLCSKLLSQVTEERTKRNTLHPH